MVRKGVEARVDEPLEIWCFYEYYCPVCNYVIHQVLYPLASNNQIKLLCIEIMTHAGTYFVDWFNYYSDQVGEAITPTIRIVDRYYEPDEERWEIAPVEVLHMWKQKTSGLRDEDTEKAETLRKHIYEAMRGYRRHAVPKSHNILPPASRYYRGMPFKKEYLSI